MKKTAPACPLCGAPDPKPIVYGFPDVKAFEAADRGEIALGGCVIREDMALWECRDCGRQYPTNGDP